MHTILAEPMAFRIRGIPLTPDKHLQSVLLAAFARLSASRDAVIGILTSNTWDPDEADCITAFNQLVGELDAGLTFVDELRDTMPPLEWRAVHRELTRAAAEMIQGSTFFALAIAAADYDSALTLQEQGNRSFIRGTNHLERIASLIVRIRNLPADGPFQADGSIDIAALAWSSGGAADTSIANGAQLVRLTLSDVPGISTLKDESAVLLLPVLASGARVVDHEILVERTKQLRSILDAADAAGPWLIDPTLLVERVQRGIDRIIAGVERFGREWRHSLPRHHIMETLTEVYRRLVEGALRDLGGIILIAARASRGNANANATYEKAVADGIKAGEVVDALSRLDASVGKTIEMLYRNASAHGDIEITDTGIIAIEREIFDGRETRRTPDVLSDAEFYEEVTGLQESLLALQLAILPWMWTHSGHGLSAAVTAMRPTPAQATRVLALLGGMAGLRDVVGTLEADHATITAGGDLDESERNAVGTATLAPGAFDVFPAAASVTLTVTGLQPVTFTRAEFAVLSADESPHKPTLIGLMTAKWLIQSGCGWTERAEATYVTFALTKAHFASMRLIGAAPQSTTNVRLAIESLRLVRARLDEIVPVEDRSPLTVRATEQIDILMTALLGLAETRDDPSRAGESQQFANQGAETVEPMFQIQEEAKAIRDQVRSS